MRSVCGAVVIRMKMEIVKSVVLFTWSASQRRSPVVEAGESSMEQNAGSTKAALRLAVHMFGVDGSDRGFLHVKNFIHMSSSSKQERLRDGSISDTLVGRALVSGHKRQPTPSLAGWFQSLLGA